MATTQAEMEARGFAKKDLDFARKTLNRIIRLREQKDAIQQQINTEFENLAAQDIEKKGAKRALQLQKMDLDKVAASDRSETLCREALGVSVQAALEFEPEEDAPVH